MKTLNWMAGWFWKIWYYLFGGGVALAMASSRNNSNVRPVAVVIKNDRNDRPRKALYPTRSGNALVARVVRIINLDDGGKQVLLRRRNTDPAVIRRPLAAA